MPLSCVVLRRACTVCGTSRVRRTLYVVGIWYVPLGVAWHHGIVAELVNNHPGIVSKQAVLSSFLPGHRACTYSVHCTAPVPRGACCAPLGCAFAALAAARKCTCLLHSRLAPVGEHGAPAFAALSACILSLVRPFTLFTYYQSRCSHAMRHRARYATCAAVW